MTERSVFVLNSQTKVPFLEGTVINPYSIPYIPQSEVIFLYNLSILEETVVFLLYTNKFSMNS